MVGGQVLLDVRNVSNVSNVCNGGWVGVVRLVVIT